MTQFKISAARLPFLIGIVSLMVTVLSGPAILGQAVLEAQPLVNAPVQAIGNSQVLANYVSRPDNSFGYELASTGVEGNCIWLRYNLTSQTWQGIPWRHVLWLIVPQSSESLQVNAAVDSKDFKFDLKDNDSLEGDDAILFIAGGSWKGDWAQQPPADLALPREFGLLARLAHAAKSPVAVIEQVPFQPLLDGRYEDAIIAETFRRYLTGEGEDWPLLLPMVKSAVRAMDVVQSEFAMRFGVSIEGFTVTGASKRGWTTWLTAAIDERVHAFAPIVIDMLNMSPQMEHQLASWGKYSEEIGDYTALNMQKFLNTPRGQMLQSIVDPYTYRASLTQPKVLIFGTNDRYWTLDACSLYWDDLKGAKYMTYTPNQGHQIRDVDRLVGSVAGLHRSTNGGPPMPKIDWAVSETQSDRVALTLTSASKPVKVQMWLAKSETRDFRSAAWVSQPMFEDSEGVFVAQIARKADGFTAFFGEMVSDNLVAPVYLSTSVTILGGP